MKGIIKKIVSIINPAECAESDFSHFVREASSREKKKIMLNALRGSINRQHALIREYDNIYYKHSPLE